MALGVADLTRAELVKVRTVRSNWVATGLGIVAVSSLAVAMAAAGGRPLGPAAPEPVILPMEYFAYVAMVLGVLMVGSDISVGTYRITLGLAMSRERVLLAKLAAGAAVGLVAGVVASVVVLASALLGGAGGQWDPASLRANLVSLLVVPLATLLGVAVGALLRNGSSAITLLLLWSLGAETVLVLVLPHHVGAYLPFKTVGASREVVGVLGPVAGLAVFAGYTAALVLLALLATRHRDAPVD